MKYSVQACKAIYDILAKLRLNGATCEDGLDATAAGIYVLAECVAADDALWAALPETLVTRVEGHHVRRSDLRDQLRGLVKEEAS